MAQVKGFAIRGLLKFVKSSGHPGGVQDVIAEVPADLQPIFRLKILHGTWYPYDAYDALLRIVDRKLGQDDLALMPRLGRFAAEQEVGSIWKLVTYFSSVETLLRRSSLFWPRYCDTGVFETRDVEPGSGVGTIRDFPRISRYHCHLLIGWIEQMAKNAGATTVEVEKTLCVHRGDPVCEYRGSWTG